MNSNPFSQNGLGSPRTSGKSKSSAEAISVKSKYGSAGRRSAPEETAEPMELPEVNAAPVDEKKSEPQAVLTEGAWIKSETHFQEETEVSVKLTLPEGKEHLTRIEAELYARSPKGPELICRSEANAKADGTAVFTLPVYKPIGHQGDPVDYFLVFKHKLAKVFDPESLMRKVSDLALKSADHVLVPGICFAKNSSFIRPKFVSGLKALETRVKDWETQHPKGKIVIYGHADSDENEPKALSERRAESVFAFITNDAATWEKLFKAEKWGLITLQHIMLDSGDYKGKPDNEDGPATRAAFKSVQKKAGLPESGKEDAATRKAVFGAYMKGKHDIKLNADRFRKVAGNSWMGCATHNKAKPGDGPAPENRRVAFILINESKFFPVHFPCQDGKEAGCLAQCKKAGKRSVTGTQCAFYDELLREEPQEAATEPESDTGGKTLKKGDKGPVVEELNIRLSGFGGGIPGDSFDDQVESKVKQFQKEWMNESSPSGILDAKTAKALDAFSSEFPIDIGSCKCKCGECGGFGKGQFKGKFKDGIQRESTHKYEYPGMHRSMLWALKGIQFHLKTLGLSFHEISSAYRCWVDNDNHRFRTSTNHMGKALDIHVKDSSGKIGGKAECDKVRTQMLDTMKGQIRWGAKNKFSMEPSEAIAKKEFLATTWVHFDVREFDSKFLDDRFFCKTNDALNGKPMQTLLGG